LTKLFGNAAVLRSEEYLEFLRLHMIEFDERFV